MRVGDIINRKENKKCKTFAPPAPNTPSEDLVPSLNMGDGRNLLIISTGRREAPLIVCDLCVDDPENLVHLLKRNTLGLWDKEPCKDEHGETERPEDEVCTVSRPTNCSHHVRGGTSNNKVEQPLSRSGHGDVGGSQAGSRNLGNINPANGTPSKLEEGCKQEDHDNRDVTSWRDHVALLRRIKPDIEADVEHGRSLSNRSPEEGFAATKRIGNKEKEDGAGDHLHDSIDTSSKETSFSSGETKVGLSIYQLCYKVYYGDLGNYLRRSEGHSS